WKLRYLELARRVRAAAKPDVVYAHFLVPSGLIASRVDAPLVVTAHGRDVRNVGAIPGVAALTWRDVRQASAVIDVSGYFRRGVGRVSHNEVPGWIAGADVVCQPSLIEPFGQSLLEGMASGRSVVATRFGGPPEFVTPEAGALVDPTDLDDLERGLRAAAALPT